MKGFRKANREHNQDGIVSVATKLAALPITLNFLAYYTVNVTIVD
jgi:hypothetical protein